MTGFGKRLLRGVLLTAALVMLCAGALAALKFPFITVTKDKVNMRSKASSSAVVLETLEQGASVEVLGESGKYFKVSYANRTGYILKEYVSTEKADMTTPTPEPVETVSGYPYSTTTRESVNLRAKKSVNATLLKKIPAGATVTVNEASGTWAEVTYGNRTGYVKSEYIVLKKVSKARVTPTPTPAPTLTPEENAGEYSVLQQGDSGAAVKSLQEALIELGYLKGKADGKFGSATHNAVIQFQSANGYPTTGVMDANIQAFLYSGKPKSAEGAATKVKAMSPVPGASIKLGNTGDAVAELQQRLKDLGYYTGEVNGTYDAATQKAVKAFQKKNGLKANGTANADTRKAIESETALGASATAAPTATPTPTPAPTYTVPKTTVKLGSEGDDAREVQRRLKELGYYRSNIDGKFGRTSVNALKKFQEANGLEPDGAAGKSTLAKLFSENALASGVTPTPAPTEEPKSSTGTLRQGDGGDAVALLQEALISLDYLTGTADGNYGEQTVKAVKAFQKANGLKVDGTAGEETLTLLYSGKAKAASAAATASPTPKAAKATATPAPNNNLKQGDKGDAVRQLQQTLIRLGYLSGTADGVFGYQTTQALIAFQRANKLKADGVAGSQTQSALSSSSATAAQNTGSSNQSTAGTSTGSASPKPSAGQVQYANWYTTVKSVCRSYPYATVYDFASGISWQIHIFSLGAHADYEPLTANDTARMEKAFGGNTWNPKAVWVVFGNGSVYLGSTHSMPHETQHITDNNFAGHSCLHFPRTQEQVNSIGPYATSHQKVIDAAWAKTQAMSK